MENIILKWSEIHILAEQEIPNYKPDVLYKILNLIIKKVNNEFIYNNLNETPINAKEYFFPISKKYKLYLDFLIKNNIVNQTSNYVNNHHSRSFSLNLKYVEESFLDIIMDKGFKFDGINDIVRKNDFDKEYNNSDKISLNAASLNLSYLDNYTYVSLLYMLLNTNINKDEAMLDANNLFIEREHNPSYKIIEGKNIQLSRFNQFLCDYTSIKILFLHKYNFHIDKNGRLHTNLTNISSHYRKHITYNSEKLCSIDIANCQPLLLLRLTDINFWSSLLNLPATLSSCLISFSDLNFTLNLDEKDKADLADLLNNIVTKPDYIKFKDSVLKGTLYQDMGELLFGYTSPIDVEQKKQIKSTMMLVLFSANKHMPASKKLFKNNYPSIYELCSILKRKSKPQLACLLQRIESHIILSNIAARVVNEHTPIPLLTIHDSCITTIVHVEHLKYIMEEELYKLLGFIPILKVEPW